MKYNRKHGTVVLATVLMIGLIAVSAFFLISNYRRIEEQSKGYLYELTVQRAESLDAIIRENLSYIRSTAYLYGKSLDTGRISKSKLKEFEENASFDNLCFVDIYGNQFFNSVTAPSMSKMDFFSNGLHGGTGVVYLGADTSVSGNMIGFYSPVYFKNEVIGILVGLYDNKRISKMLDYDLFEVQGQGWLCDKNGTVICSNKEFDFDNYINFLEKEGGCSPEEVSHVTHLLSYGQGASFSFSDNGTEVRCCAAAVPYAGWVLIRSFPPDAYRAMLAKTNRHSLLVILILALVFAAYVGIMSYSFSRERKQLDKERKDAEDIASGMAGMFGNCLTVDLGSERYEYVVGEPDDPSLPPEGEYLKYYESLMTRIDDLDNRRSAAGFFNMDNLRSALTGRDSVSMRVHLSGENVDEWAIFTFTLLSKEDGEPRRLLLVSHEAS